MSERKTLIHNIVEGLNVLNQQMVSKYGDVLPKFDLTHSQWLVLSVIEHGNHVTIKHVRETLGVSSSAVTQMINVLEHKGFVRRTQSSADRRVVVLKLSPKAEKVFKEFQEKTYTLTTDLFTPLTNKELKQYVSLLYKLIESEK